MSLLPMLFSHWWEDLERPHRLLDQNFGLTLRPEDIVGRSSSANPEMLVLRPDGRLGIRLHPGNRYDAGHSHGVSTVRADRDQFRVTLDVQQFTPEEVAVKVVDRCIVVDAKHEEKKDEHGWISRQFSRRYLVPSQCDVEQVSSSLSSDGVLTITAPRIKDPTEKAERVITIQHTGQPAIKEAAARPGPADGKAEQKDQSGEKNGVKSD